jgi:hypothetical protein
MGHTDAHCPQRMHGMDAIGWRICWVFLTNKQLAAFTTGDA